MNQPLKPHEPDEQALIRCYVELTGCTEGEARSVLIHTCLQGQLDEQSDGTSQTPQVDGKGPIPGQ
jgi:hypothetical protein